MVILVNPQGCAARFNRPVEVGATVRLEGLPRGGANARVVNCISVEKGGKLWLLGLALDEPGNVWGSKHRLLIGTWKSQCPQSKSVSALAPGNPKLTSSEIGLNSCRNFSDIRFHSLQPTFVKNLSIEVSSVG